MRDGGLWHGCRIGGYCGVSPPSRVLQAVRISETRNRFRAVRALNLYYNTKEVADLADLRNNWAAWKKLRAVRVAPGENEVPHRAPRPPPLSLSSSSPSTATTTTIPPTHVRVVRTKGSRGSRYRGERGITLMPP